MKDHEVLDLINLTKLCLCSKIQMMALNYMEKIYSSAFSRIFIQRQKRVYEEIYIPSSNLI